MQLFRILRPRSMGGWYRLYMLGVELPWLVLMWLLHLYAGLNLVLSLLLMLALPLGLRILFTHRTFQGARVHGIHAAPLNWWQRMALYWGEVLAMLRMFAWYMPWRGNVRRAGQGVPIVCVHGFICSGAVWQPMAAWLQRRGQGPIVSLSLYPPFESIDRYSEALAQLVEQTCMDSGRDKVHLLGHSMGGLVIRNYLHQHGHAAVQSIVTLGSPHHGTIIARAQLKLGENLVQMRIKSAWLGRLNAHEAAACPVPITSIWSPQDNVVLPQDTSVLAYPNARNIKLPGYGHDALLYSRKVWRIVLEKLEQNS